MNDTTHKPPVYLVGCGKSKLAHAAPARALYTGPLFRKSLAVAEREAAATGGTVLILSAEYGAVPLDGMLDPYDLALTSLSAAERRAWGEATAIMVRCRLGISAAELVERRLVAYAGHAYVWALMHGIAEDSGWVPRIEQPLKGLTMGRRLSRLNGLLGEGR